MASSDRSQEGALTFAGARRKAPIPRARATTVVNSTQDGTDFGEEERGRKEGAREKDEENLLCVYSVARHKQEGRVGHRTFLERNKDGEQNTKHADSVL